MSSTVTTATADTEVGRRIRALLSELDVVRSPLFREGHDRVEVEAAEAGLWEAIADVATTPREAGR